MMTLKINKLPPKWKFYPQEQSPLFNLQSKRRLAKLLYREPKHLFGLLQLPAKERFCIRPQTVKEKVRIVQVPRGDLKKIHRRLFCLLNQIQLPDYVYSGRRGRSYIDNAKVHVGSRVVYKLDIEKFFQRVMWGDVFRFFRHDMGCAQDVAGLLSDLCTVDPDASPLCPGGHIPTGSSISMALAYWAFAPMFDAIFQLADMKALKMTLYVDDITFSGDEVPKSFVRQVKMLIGGWGLHAHKERGWAPGRNSVVTGVLVTPWGVRLPNTRRRQVLANIRQFREIGSLRKRYAHLKRLVGQLCEARQLDTQFVRHADYYQSLLKTIKRRVKTATRRRRRLSRRNF